jgi:hypothetical protein
MGDGIGDFAFGLSIGAIGLGLLLGPVGRALGNWIESKIGPGRRRLPEEVEARLAEVDAMEQRILEMEERLEFAERCLAQLRLPAPVDADTPPEPVDAVG